jgi:DNA polymerase (family 10)
VRAAIDAGVHICISTDAHAPQGLDVMRYGVDAARRGWATAADVVNTRTWPEVRALGKPGRPAGPLA